jgi:hypothetical protein
MNRIITELYIIVEAILRFFPGFFGEKLRTIHYKIWFSSCGDLFPQNRTDLN